GGIAELRRDPARRRRPRAPRRRHGAPARHRRPDPDPHRQRGRLRRAVAPPARARPRRPKGRIDQPRRSRRNVWAGSGDGTERRESARVNETTQTARLDALRNAMGTAGIDLLAVAPTDNLRYMLGFAPKYDERACMLLVAPGATAMLMPSL